MQPRLAILPEIMPSRYLIIDDDPMVRSILAVQIQKISPHYQLLASSANGEEGIEAIVQHQPDLVFLDVELDDMTGFELLQAVHRRKTDDFQTIFISSYTYYAIKALRIGAMDYLLKPFDPKEIQQAIKRFEQILTTERPKQISGISNQKLEELKPSERILSLQLREGESLISVESILFLEGERNYTSIHYIDGTKKLTSKTLGDTQMMLDSNQFFRTHKSYIVNRQHIKGRPQRNVIMMRNYQRIPISRRRVSEFEEWWGD
ncbi:MAG: LytTR family DNA-binding domain-containing protein [Bacteroidota bacterium]